MVKRGLEISANLILRDCSLVTEGFRFRAPECVRVFGGWGGQAVCLNQCELRAEEASHFGSCFS